MHDARASVLIVDDEPDSQRALQGELQAQDVEGVVCHPADVTRDDIREKDLILVDYVLKDWRDSAPAPCLARDPCTGLALAQVLRSHEDRYPTAFALHTGELPMLAGRIPSHREHVIARLHDLEWVFPKASSRLVTQIKSLALAVNRLPRKWPEGPAERMSAIHKLLNLPSEDEGEEYLWAEQAFRDVEACQPPVHDLSEHTHGLAFVRWLLHRVLPYPCFLLDQRRFAVRLGLDPTSFEERWAKDEGLRTRCEDFRYRGILADFLGPQFWGAAVDQFIWGKTDGQPNQRGRLHSWLSDEQDALEPLAVPYAVLCLDAQLRPSGVHSVEDTVQIQPDDWPSYADQARVSLTLAKESPEVRSIVVRQDCIAHGLS